MEPDKRLKWYGIEPLEETDAKKLDDMYGNDCKCDFDCEFKCTCCQFKCTCGWNENITLNEHKSFQNLRKVSKPGIQRQPNLTLLIVDRNVMVFIDPLQSLTRNTIRSKIQWNQKSAIKFLYLTKKDLMYQSKIKIVTL